MKTKKRSQPTLDSRQPSLDFDRKPKEKNEPELTPLQKQVVEILRAEQAGKASAPAESSVPMPVRRLQNYAYCPRLFYYQWVENIFLDNADTVKGSSQHRHVDQPSRLDDPANLDLPQGTRLRSLHYESETLGLTGKIDVIEAGENGLEIIDHKKGSARRDDKGQRTAKEADAIQVAAYVLLLREAGHTVSAAWIYYAEDRRRVEVPLTEELLSRCLRLRDEARALASSATCPPPLRDDPRCLYCSAYPVCLPNESAFWSAPHGAGDKQTVNPPMPDGDDGEILVVQTAGAMVGFRSGEIVVTHKETALGKCPVHQLCSVHLYGAVQLTAQAAQTLLEKEIPVAYFSPAGRYLGMLTPLPASGVDARMGQYRLFGEPQMRLSLAREIIRAKIHNQRVMLMRNGEASGADLDTLASLRDKTADAASPETLLGLEGAAAAIYFQNFTSMIKGQAQWQFDFQGRNRRPPRDPVNALLSMGYSMLAKELAGVCHAVGLDPFLGFYHQPRYGRPALALDMMEEFRPLIADSVVLSLLNRNEIAAPDFISGASGCFMNQEGRRAFWENYFRRMDTEVAHPQFGYKMSYRRMLSVQVRQLWRFVRGEAAQYIGFTTR